MNNGDFGAYAARQLIEGRRLLRTANISGSRRDWEAVLASPSFWSLRHESGIISVRNMNQVELEQSLVEDLIFTAVENGLGSATSYPVSQATRHLGRATNMAAPIMDAVRRVLASGLAVEAGDGLLAVNHERLKDAQEFCGVYMGKEEDTGPDWADDVLGVGGEALLGEVFGCMADELIEQDNIPKSER